MSCEHAIYFPAQLSQKKNENSLSIRNYVLFKVMLTNRGPSPPWNCKNLSIENFQNFSIRTPSFDIIFGVNGKFYLVPEINGNSHYTCNYVFFQLIFFLRLEVVCILKIHETLKLSIETPNFCSIFIWIFR